MQVAEHCMKSGQLGGLQRPAEALPLLNLGLEAWEEAVGSR